jgi:hypothetical protein
MLDPLAVFGTRTGSRGYYGAVWVSVRNSLLTTYALRMYLHSFRTTFAGPCYLMFKTVEIHAANAMDVFVTLGYVVIQQG